MPKILIIDDDPDIVESIKVVLESEKYDVVTAPTGEEGLRQAEEENPDLIMLDVMMETGTKGFEVARELRNKEAHKNTPILMLTALKSETGLDFKGEAGDEVWLPVDDFCDKPLKPDEIITKVEKLLNKG